MFYKSVKNPQNTNIPTGVTTINYGTIPPQPTPNTNGVVSQADATAGGGPVLQKVA